MGKKKVHRKKAVTYQIRIVGLVQGVGFRPFLYRIASDWGLKGWVGYRNDGLILEVNGSERQLEAFEKDIRTGAPQPASIESLDIREIPHESFESFEIRERCDDSDSITEISPDIAVCPDCLDDLRNQIHRTDYPLINCAHCGPRFSIIRDLPYNRDQTTMSSFPMCPLCRSEYNDLHDRRFHAQAVACNQCGPTYLLEHPGGAESNIKEILRKCCELLSDGALLAVKGTGGFYLVGDAFSSEAVSRLRSMKQMSGKPFAVMFRNLEEAGFYCEMGEVEKAELSSWRRPMVLLKKKKEITRGIADRLDTLGAMLPHMPFHHQLFEQLKTPALVMTSANFPAVPILISNEEVRKQFEPHVDGIVSYNRDIFNRIDDSVSVIIRREPRVIRRARGFAPSPIPCAADLEGILGTGAEFMGSFCIGRGHLALMSPYTGDLKNLETFAFYQETYERFCRLFSFTPRLVVSDLHPSYLSSGFAGKLAALNPEIEHMSVQHHHAHIASGMLDAGLEGEVLGFSFDGIGMGTDGHMWGAEVMKADYGSFERLFHFEYMPLPGGEKASKEPWKMGLSYLYHCFGEEIYNLNLPLIRDFRKQEIAYPISLIQKNINTPLVSSAGHLFDAVAAITGLNYRSTYRGEAPMLLESAIDPNEEGIYSFSIDKGQVSFRPLIRELVEDIYKGKSIAAISARFHRSLVHLILHLSMEIREASGLDRVVLGGETFQNRYLSEKVIDKLENELFKVYLPRRIPVNDQGIAAGQLAIGAYRMDAS